ncbi:Pilus assembly protein, PilO [Thiorhodovibrio winogradskyi]|uniref:Pilus assembly protein, PilO n=1 Tax=Thiorhodovibrio winogradskyi TaxID=77007 RepID=A0ABZ0S5J4_9GAMM|nr:type 4a pilus biogenesis protein PilO [Thiorhodovibrio winogradskyi]
MDLNQLNEIDFNNLGEAPLPVKAVLIVLLCAGIGYGWYHFNTKNQIDQLKVAERKETELKQTFETKQKKAANLDNYKQQLAEMDESFEALLKRLPNETEVDDLLIDVSQTGLAAGLEFKLFRPTGEEKRDFYAEYPIQINVVGKYHQFGEFVSGLAALPRIVTIHNISTNGDNLSATVKTYRYLKENAL